MAHSTRQLHFVVGTSLLTAALLVPSVGCKDKTRVNEGPEPPHTNEGPQTEPPADADAGSIDADQPEPGDPEAEPSDPEAEPEPKHVNTQKVPDRP
jgi:hypothetical protein